MKFSMIGQEKGDLLNTNGCLIEVTAWAGLTVHCNSIQLFNKFKKFFF
jgi:hypothetical protein